MLPCPLRENAILRRFTPEDAPELFALVDRNRAWLKRWLPWLDYNRSPDDSRAFLKLIADQDRAGKGFNAAIELNGRIVGIAGFHPMDLKNKQANLGYWISEDAQGQGLVTLAVQALTKIAFESYGLNRIEIRCATGNRASQQVAKRLGFRHEGTLRQCEWLYDRFVDHEVFSRLRADPPVGSGA